MKPRLIRTSLWLLLCLWASSGVCQDAASSAQQPTQLPPLAKPVGIVDFNRDIAPLLQARCVSCHQGEGAKNGFVVGDREAVMGFLQPGVASDSSLWTDYLIQPSKRTSKDSLVMPPDGPLPASELALFKLWIDEGAVWPEGVKLGATAPAAPPVDPNSPWYLKAYRAIGYFHPAMVHFPIALFLVGGVLVTLSYFLGQRCQSTAFQCIVVATVASIATAVMGWSFAEIRGYASWDTMLAENATHEQENFFFHRWLGTAIAILGVICVIAGLFARRYKSIALNHFWRAAAIVLAILVCIVGHQGGELVYGELYEKVLEQFGK